MGYTDEQVRAIQQEIQGATGMTPQPKQPSVNDQWGNYIGGMIDEQIQKNTPVSQQQKPNIFAQQQKPQAVVPPANTNTGNTFNVGSYQTKPAATETGGGNYDTKGADYLSSMFTTPEEEERLRKASVARQRIAAVGDVLRHIGNLYFASQGATPQTFNNPAEEERKRYLQERAYRDKRNQMYMTYQQAKAAQEARIAQMQAQNQLRADLNAAQVQNYKDRAEEYARHNKAIEDLNKSKAETAAQNAQRNYEHKVETDKRRLDISQQRANKSGGGRSRTGGSGGSRTGGYRQTTRYTYNDKGVRTGSVVEKTPTGTFDQQNGRRSLLPGGNARGGSLLPK